MSVIVKNQDGDIIIYSKGSDEAIKDRVDKDYESTDEYEIIMDNATNFSREGLRTLIVA